MKASISGAVLSDLIGQIYDCAIDPGRWELTLGRMREAVNCLNAIFGVQAMPSGRILLAVTSGIDAAHRARMDDYGADVIDQWGGLETFASYPFEEPAVLSWKRPGAFMENNRYYEEWARPQGIIDVMGFFVARDASAFGSVGLGRHVSAGPVTQNEFETLRLIVPHVQRAVSISRMLDIKTIAAQSFAAALDAVTAGIVLVDADLRIVHANAAADAMLTAGDPISSAGGILTVRFGAAQQALGEAVAQVSRDEALIGRRGFGIPVRQADGDPAVLYVLPLKRGTLRPGLFPSAAAAIFVASATAQQPAPEQALAALFDFTPAEAKVFSLIASGKTLAKTAEALGIGQSTAKTHLVRIFAKTGTSRQAELVKLAASLAMSV